VAGRLQQQPPEIICKFGTQEQKKRFVSPMFDGTKCFSVQFTEPDTGSDSRVLKTTARPDGDYYIINGQKRFSTFGARDGTAIVWTKDEEGGCTAFLVDKTARLHRPQNLGVDGHRRHRTGGCLLCRCPRP